MPTEKRTRKREGRMARQQAMEEARRRHARRRRFFTLILPAAIALLALAFFTSRGEDEGDETDVATSEGCPAAGGESTRTTAFATAPPNCIDPEKTYTAEVATTKGTFTITLDPERAPQTVNSFVFLARHRFYEGVLFHRIIPGFVVQGGDPQGTGSGGPGYEFADELPEAGEYKIGSVAMANSGPDTNGSQFFVITGDQGVQLPPSYSLFGQVTEGMDVVQALEAVGTPGAGTPTEEVKIEEVTIHEAE